MPKLTPMMEQYMDLKKKYSDCILFFRLGDFYEMFFEDAITSSRELEIALTARDCGLEEKAPMCGVPYHSADNYISKLVDRGYKVAICEQVEDPSKAKGIVKRDVIKIVTSGTITDMEKLDEKTNNYLMAIYIANDKAGISYVDITTGDIYTTDIEPGMVLDKSQKLVQSAIDEIGKVSPNEIILNMEDKTGSLKTIESKFADISNRIESWYFDREKSLENILNQFDVHSLSGLGLDKKKPSMVSTGSLLEYLRVTQKRDLDHIRKLQVYSADNYMILDINTRNNLELVETIRGKSKKGSLLNELDLTSTAMGGRLIKKWIEEPLVNKSDIENRLDRVEAFSKNISLIDEISESLKGVYDIERLVGKLVYGNCNGKDLISLKNSISKLPHIKKTMLGSGQDSLISLVDNMDLLEDVYSLIDHAIEDEPPISITEGNLIKATYNDELSDLRDISINGKSYLAKLESSEREKTGIKNLKIKYNKVFGYFIELSKSNIDKAPDEYIRKQTLANSERYITDELKKIEDRILGSQDKMIELEYNIFNQIKEDLKSKSDRIQSVAKIISRIDVLNSLARVAYLNNYTRPIIREDGITKILDGRHPVVEKMVEDGMFIPNDTSLDYDDNRVMIITGPNMSGKSTYMRQVAIINLLAQIGSFVPATRAEVSIADRIFTRIGASDDLSEGQSTFMVEMSEVSNILNNATKKSLVILDEIGRGTSTYDGLSIAWAVIEHISKKENIGARTLFATHYHELTELEDSLAGIKNYRIKVEENQNDGIVFLRKIERGGADRSYGIEVAKLAGVKDEVILRANDILRDLEKDDKKQGFDKSREDEKVKEKKEEDILDYRSGAQMNIFGDGEDNLEPSQVSDEYIKIIEEIENMDIARTTPLDALNTLYTLWERVKNTKD